MEDKSARVKVELNAVDRAHTSLYRYLENVSIKRLQNTSRDNSGVDDVSHSYGKDKALAVKIPNKIKVKESTNNNPVTEDHYAVFRKSTLFLLIWGQIIGLCPVLGVLEEEPTKLRFTVFSWRFLYSMLIFILQTVCAVACLLATLYEVTAANCTLLVYYGCCSISNLLFIRAASKWPSVAEEVSSSSLDVDPHVKVKCIRTFFIILSMGVFEHILFIISCYTTALDCHPDNILQSVNNMNFGFLFELGIRYNIVLGILLQFISVMSSMCWSYSDLFVICISIYLTGLLDELCKKIRTAKNKDLPSTHWKSLRKQYTDVTKLVRSFDELINATIFLSFATTLLFICLQIFNILRFGFRANIDIDCPNYPSGPFAGYEHAVYFIYSSLFILARSIMFSLFASNVHTASLKIAPELYGVPSSIGNEINRFIEQAHGDTVALTGFQFFDMTRGIVLSVAGTIITYELVLMQFNGENMLD